MTNVIRAIDGPFLQRASTVASASLKGAVDLSIAITPELPSYITGFTDPAHTDYMSYSTSFDIVAKDYAADSPMELFHSGCKGSCSAIVHAPALAVESCTSELHYTNFSVPLTTQQISKFNSSNQELARDRLILNVKTVPV
jgi:hypothetical protein